MPLEVPKSRGTLPKTAVGGLKRYASHLGWEFVVLKGHGSLLQCALAGEEEEAVPLLDWQELKRHGILGMGRGNNPLQTLQAVDHAMVGEVGTSAVETFV